MQAPPSRYKVVERGRRLEVIDTHTGAPASAPFPRAGAGGAMRQGRAGNLSGVPARDPHTRGQRAGADADADADTFVTRRWFDEKAPRRIRLNFTNRQRLLNLRWGIAFAVALLVALSFLFWPLAMLLGVALATGPKLRAQLRAASTRWIDGFDQAA